MLLNSIKPTIKPLSVCPQSSGDPVTQCEFHPKDMPNIVCCGKSQISFWTLEGGKLDKKAGIFQVGAQLCIGGLSVLVRTCFSRYCLCLCCYHPNNKSPFNSLARYTLDLHTILLLPLLFVSNSKTFVMDYEGNTFFYQNINKNFSLKCDIYYAFNFSTVENSF